MIPLTRWSARARARWAAQSGFGFDTEELERLVRYYRRLGRDPSPVEIAGIAQSWSEHCSYKSSRRWLRRYFSGLVPGHRVLGTGDAGVVRFEPGFAYALRIESHNHPSAVEPYGGAATGIGGILRDILAVGGKPIALADPLFFGPLETDPVRLPPGVKSPTYLMNGIIAGIRDYGNRVGVPTVSGGVYFDPAYLVNPLVNVASVGFLPIRRLQRNRARRAGNRLVLAGGRTGRDGIGGVAFASRELTEESGSESRGAVQLGNPILKEPLIRACLEAFEAGYVASVKDLGGGGLATAAGELVFAGGFGLELDLDRVPQREAGLKPWEVWISESQERMILEVPPGNVPALIELFERRDVPATVVGRVTREPTERLRWHGKIVSDIDLAFRVDPPLRSRPRRRRRRPAARKCSYPDEPLAATVARLLLDPQVVSREPILRLYDHEVQGRTVVKPLQGGVAHPTHGDAAVLRPRPESRRGLALATATQPWLCAADPEGGGAWVVEEAARNLFAVGARPDALTNCLNFGPPTDPQVMDDFVRVVRGMASAARALGFVVPSGNVSFYNGGLGREIPPTPVVLATGVLADWARATTTDLKRDGDLLYLLGKTDPRLGGSLWARQRGLTRGETPRPNPRGLARLGDALLLAGRAGIPRAVHDVSDGGVAVAVAEMAFGGATGFALDLDRIPGVDPRTAAVTEGGSRFVVEIRPDDRVRWERICRGLPIARIGTVQPGRFHFRVGGDSIAILDGDDLYSRWRTGGGAP
ncbi:MAG: phosphoribosylformylglycinamidine synthase subunit PurL [Thermoplasmata archaeon]